MKLNWSSRSRERARQFQVRGQQPAVLLVYGIPLRVDDLLFSHWFNQDQEFLNLAQSKAEELVKLCWRLNIQLDDLLGQSKSSADRAPVVHRRYSALSGRP